ncbi:MAG: cytochrome c [Crocinitomicaceae bacterium]|nr:cytochrome c [Crocinitomicaceae bacterium]
MKNLVFVLAAAGFLIACTPKTSEIVEVAETSEETATDGDMPKADIGEGKVIFLKDCIPCHTDYTGPTSVERLKNYSKERVDAVLPKMINNAELNETQSRQITAYLHWELEN